MAYSPFCESHSITKFDENGNLFKYNLKSKNVLKHECVELFMSTLMD